MALKLPPGSEFQMVMEKKQDKRKQDRIRMNRTKGSRMELE
jgi:hypothetical protein